MLITPLKTATPTIRRAMPRSACATGSSAASVDNNVEMAQDGDAAFTWP
jgi:hypothetical protein